MVFFGAALFGLELRLKASRLVFGVVELAERVAQLAAMHEQLEAIDQRRVGIFLARQRRDLERVIDDEHRNALLPVLTAVIVDQERLRQVLVGDEQPLARRGAVTERTPQVAPIDLAGALALLLVAVDDGVGRARQALAVGAHHERQACELVDDRLRQPSDGQRLLHRRTHWHTRERLVERERTLGAQLHGGFTQAERLQAREHERVDVTKQRFGHRHQRVVRGVRHVKLEHRELGVVARADAFVAVAATNLVDALEATNQQALEVQLGRDAQKQAQIERIVMRLERTRGRAANQRMQGRRLDLQEISLIQKIAQALHDQRPRTQRDRDLRVGDQVDVTTPVAQVGVGQAVPLVGQRAQGLGDQPDRRQLDRELTGLGDHRPTARLDVVGDVDRLERDKAAAQNVLLGEQLQLAGAVAQPQEAGLAEAAAQHHAPKDDERLLVADALDLHRIVAQLFFVDQRRRELGAKGVDGAPLVELHVVGKGVLTLLTQTGGFLAPLLHQRLF